MRIESSFDVSLQVSGSAAEPINVFTSLLNLTLVWLVVVLSDRDVSSWDQGFGERFSNSRSAVETEHRQLLVPDFTQCGCRRVAREYCGCKLSVEATDVAGELRKCEVDHAVQMADAIA